MNTKELPKLILHSLIIFLILSLNFIFLPISGGENHYLQFAKQFSDPNWIPNSFTLTEFPGTRLIFQYIFGPLFKYFEFDLCTLLLRLLNFALVSIPMAKLFRYFKFRPFEWILLFQLFLLPIQSFFAREWMFGTFEPKTVAYVFVLWAFLGWLNKKNYWTVLWAAVACYFHILVGGWFMIAVALVALFQKELRNWIKPGFLFFLLLIPFLIYLLPVYFSNEVIESSKPLDFIYVYYRLAHHLGLFSSIDYFVSSHMNGVLLTTVSFALCLYVYKYGKPYSKRLTLWISVCFGVCIFFTFLAFIDFALLDRSGGLGLKYYPFRLNSFGYFLLFFLIFSFFKDKNYFGLNRKVLSGIFITVAIITCISRIQYAVDKDKAFTSKTDYWELIRHVNSMEEKQGIYLLAWEDFNNEFYYNFSRLTGKENFTVHKFVPAEKKKLAMWYERQMDLKALGQNKMTSEEICEKYVVTHIISEKAITEPNFDQTYENDTYFIYEHIPPE